MTRAILAAALALPLAIAPPALAQQEGGLISHLEQVNEDGFGNHNNRYAWSMKSFGDHLFVGTLNTTLGLPFERWPFDPRKAAELPKIRSSVQRGTFGSRRACAAGSSILRRSMRALLPGSRTERSAVMRGLATTGAIWAPSGEWAL